MGCTTCTLGTSSGRAQAIPLYLRFGFQPLVFTEDESYEWGNILVHRQTIHNPETPSLYFTSSYSRSRSGNPRAGEQDDNGQAHHQYRGGHGAPCCVVVCFFSCCIQAIEPSLLVLPNAIIIRIFTFSHVLSTNYGLPRSTATSFSPT